MEKNNSITRKTKYKNIKGQLKSLGFNSLKLLLTSLLFFGVFTVNINNQTVTVKADDLYNTVPNDESDTNLFYTNTIQTGFTPNGYRPPATMYGPGYGPHTVAEVYQSQSTVSPTSFAAGLPLGTIFIDQTKIPEYGGVTEVVSKDTEIIAGLVLSSNNCMGYDGTKPGAKKMVPNTINKLNGDLFKVTFADAAILPNGDRADLVITYSNAEVVIDQRYMAAPVEDRYYHGAVYLARGNAFSRGGTDNTDMRTFSDSVNIVDATARQFGSTYTSGNAGGTNKTPVTGVTMDATYTIVNKDNTPAAGTFVFAVCGINLDRDPDVGGGNNLAKPLWYSFDENFGGLNGEDHSFFSEAMEITGGIKSDYVYVRPNTSQEDNPSGVSGLRGQYFYPNVSLHNGNIKFISNSTNSPSLSGHDNSYSAGFVTLADAATGFKVRATGHGNAEQGMNSHVFNSKQIWYRYTSSSGAHGNIQTTSEGNYNGKLNDGGNILGPSGAYDYDASSPKSNRSTYVVTEGKTVTYTMTPEVGYKASRVIINRNVLDFNDDEISKMKKGDSITVDTADFSEWPDSKNGKGVLTYEGNGVYTFVFNYATANEDIHVDWEPTTADILTYKIWADDDDKDGIRAAADRNGTLPKFKLQWSLNGRNWKDVENQMDIGLRDNNNNPKPYILPTPVTEKTVPAGKVGEEYKDGVYVMNYGTPASENPKRPAHPFTWEYLPVYTYDSTGRADRAIQYRIVEIDDPWHKEYEKAEYFEQQIFDLLSPEDNSIEGWTIYTDGTNDYVKKGDGLYYTVDSNGVANTNPINPQPNEDDLDTISTSSYWTADHAVPYHEVQAKNRHFTTDLYVDVVKEWNDSILKIDPEDPDQPDINDYARQNIKIVLHGEIEGATQGSVEVVDLDPNSDEVDLIKTITTDESDKKEDVTGYIEVNGYTKYIDSDSNEFVYVENKENVQNGYYPVSAGSVDYNDGPYNFGRGEVTPVRKNEDGTYKINTPEDNKFGAMFEGLPTHYKGKHITYTVTETDENGNPLDSWILTGGNLNEVKKGEETIGYETVMVNTPDVDIEYSPLPIKIIKQDINTGNPLEGAEFTVYVNETTGEKASASENLQVGKKIYTKAVGNTTTDYVIQKDNNDNKYKYYEVVNGAIAANPANPQPNLADLQENGKLNPEDGWTDGQNIYVKRNEEYYLVDGEGNISTTPSNPDLNLIRKAKNPKSGQVDKNVVVTDANGNAMINFLKPNEGETYYYVKETKAPEGYNPDPTTYVFKVDADLKTITLQGPNNEHVNSWWQKLYDLIFGNVDNVEYPSDVWQAGENNRSGELTVKNTPIKADILVRKYWNDNDNQDGKRPGDKNNPSSTDDTSLDDEFKLPSVTLKYTISGHTAGGSNVYKTSDSDTKYVHNSANDKYYIVISEDVVGSYEVDVSTLDNETTLVSPAETCKGLPVYEDNDSNKYVVVDGAYHKVITIDVAGEVEDQPATEQPDVNLLNLVMDEGTDWINAYQFVADDARNPKTNYVGGPILTHQNDAYTWTNLPAYIDGKLVTYRIVENDDPENPLLANHIYDIESNHTSQTHEKTFNLANTSGEEPTSLNQTVDITNKHETQIINIEVFKQWDDQDERDRSESKIRLYKVVNGIETIVTKGEAPNISEDIGDVPVTIPTDVEDNPLPIKVWYDLPTYEGGYPITYLLKEDDIEGYIAIFEAIYDKADDGSDDEIITESDSILAEDVERTFYESTDELPEDREKKVGDENTTAKFEIINERSVNVKVSKTWINGANANVTYELWRTIVKEEDLNASAFKEVAIDAADPNLYYVDNNVYISADEYNDLSAEEKLKYTKKYINDNDASDIISVEEYEALSADQQIDYTDKYFIRSIINKETYETLSPEEKAKYSVEVRRTWSPFADGSKDPSEYTDGTNTISAAEYKDLSENDKKNYKAVTVDGWELVASHEFDANKFENSPNGYEQTHAFNDLLIKDGDGNVYLYRVLEKPELLRFRENQVSNTEIINNNVNVSDGNVSLEVVKEIQGREWISNDKIKDQFYFLLEPVKGIDLTQADNPVDINADKVPMPYLVNPSNGQIIYNYTADAVPGDLQVGAIGRAATFQNIQFKENSNEYYSIPRGSTVEFYYKVYEIYKVKTVDDEVNNKQTITVDIDLDEATNSTGYLKGITYDGEVVDNEFKPTVKEAKVIVTNTEGVISTITQWKNEKGEYKTGAVPVYTNTYSSKGEAKAWIEKKISDRNWIDFDSANQTGDAYRFRVESVSGAELNTPGATEDISYQSKPLISNTEHNPQSDIKKISDTEYAFGLTGNPYDNTMLNEQGYAYFIYEITEESSVNYSDDHYTIGSDDNPYVVDGLEYDKSRIYAKVKAEDNWDGTIGFTVEYYSDATCREDYKLDKHKVWIYDDGTQTTEGKRIVDPSQWDALSAMDPKEALEEGYRLVDVAYFVNRQTDDIPVIKRWVDGPAIEPVNLHIERHLFPITGEEAIDENTITDAYVLSQSEGNDDFWETYGYTHIIDRDDFLNNDGSPKYDKGSDNTSSHLYENIDKFNKDLPQYTDIDGITYRIVYRLLEDDTSNTYDRSYMSINIISVDKYNSLDDSAKEGYEPKYVNNNDANDIISPDEFADLDSDSKANYTNKYVKETDGDYIYSDGDILVVINTVEATNTANIAAVKQLLNRNWLDEDDFKFIINPVGKAVYDQNDKVIDIKETEEIPMPTRIIDYVNKNNDSDIISADRYNELSANENENYVANTTQDSNDAHAKKDYTVVDPNGNLERLARFDQITFSTSDLVFDKTNNHMHNDFFYEMKEDIPSDAKAYDKTSGELVDGIVFDESIRSDYIWKKAGITYDSGVHTIHISVNENRTDELQVFVAYDEEKLGDITSGTQFTPVYTNTYDASQEFGIKVDKYIMGRNWKADDVFDFRMTAMSGAPFEDANKDEDFPPNDTQNDEGRNQELEDRYAIHSARGAHVKRMFVNGDESEDDVRSLDMPNILFRLSELNKVTNELDQADPKKQLKYSDGRVVPAGVAYGQFIYSFEETNDYLKQVGREIDDLILDPDTEYARVTVIDKLDGTFDIKTEIFEDRYCTIERTIPGTVTPATNPVFVNQLKRQLSITKTWVDPATSDIVLRLQWSTDGISWYGVDEAEWLPAGIRNTQTISKNAYGKDLTVTWYNLPAYANITDRYDQEGDDQALNDKWVYYRIIEDNIPNVQDRYSYEPYEGESIDNEKFFKKTDQNGPHTGPEKVDDQYVTDRVKNLNVTNWPDDLTGEARVGIVKQYIGKEWTNEEFTFEIIPIESMIGNEDTPVKEGQKRKTGYHYNEATGKVISSYEFEQLPTEEKSNYIAQEKVNEMPKYNIAPNYNNAVASKNTDSVSVNERSANFYPLTIKLSDLAVDTTGSNNPISADYNPNFGKAVGTFYYKVKEVIPDGYVEITDKDVNGNDVVYRVVDDGKGNKIKYTTEEHIVKIVAVDDGSGHIDITTSYDDRNSGEYVPVYTNYAMLKTPIVGDKTWIGGEDSEHTNGTVTIDEIDKSITKSTDKLELLVQRKLDKDENPTTLRADDAGRELVIVWASVEEKTEIINYAYSTDGISPDEDTTDIISASEIDENDICSDGDTGCYVPNEKNTYFELEEHPSGDGEYTIMAKDNDDNYYQPFLKTTDEYGNLYIYSIVENAVPEDYEVSYDGLHITNTNVRKDTIKVTKTWNDDNDIEGIRPQKVTVHLYKQVVKDDTHEVIQVEVAKQDILRNKETEGITWNVPVYDEKGIKIKYIVIEEPVNGYTSTYSLENGEYLPEGNDALKIELDNDKENPQVMDIKNSIIKVSLEFDKNWVDLNEIRPTSGEYEAWIKLYRVVEGKEPESVDVSPTIIDNNDDTYTITYVGLDRVDEDGKVYTYYVKETAGKYYEATKILDENNDEVTFTSDAVHVYDAYTLENTQTLRDITVRKIWVDDLKEDGGDNSNLIKPIRPNSITIKLSDDNGQTYTREATLQEDGITYDIGEYTGTTFSFTFTELPVYKDGNVIKYTVDEDETNNYHTVIGVENDDYTIVNTYKITSISGKKIWIDGGLTHNYADEVELKLYRKGSDNKWIEVVNPHLDWDKDGNFTFNKLDVADENNTRFVYRVSETKVAKYDNPVYANTGDYSSETEYLYDGGTITNTISQEKISIDVEKVWVGENNEDVTVQLLADGKQLDEIVLNEDNEWKYTFTDLDKYALANDATNRGHEIKYTINEDQLADSSDYHTSIEGNMYEGFKITNSFDETTIPVIKIWKDNNNQDGIRPESISVSLLLNGEIAKDLHGKDVAEIVLNEENSWSNVFKDVPRTDENGVIEYTVKETIVPEDYEVEYSGNNNGFIITNTHKTSTVEISASKLWIDSNGGKQEFHTDVVLHLYGRNADGAIVYDAGAKTIVNNPNGVSLPVTWSDLPEYHYDSSPLVWDIVEENIFGYAPSYVWNEAKDICVVTNTYVGPVTSISVTKDWQDSNDIDSVRPESITYQLVQKIDDEETVIDEVTVKDDYSYKWDNLQVTTQIETEETNSVDRYVEKEVNVYQKIDDETVRINQLAYDELSDDEKLEYSQAIEVTTTIVYINNDDHTDIIDEETYNSNPDYADKYYQEIKVDEKPITEMVSYTETVEETVMKEVPILYSVREVYSSELEDNNYQEPVVTSVAPGEFVAINTREQDLTEITVNKVWNDNDNAELYRPDHITVSLLQDGEVIDKVYITEEMEWTYTFKNLIKNKEKGVAYTYSVEEEAVDKYTKLEVFDENRNAWIITNTHKIGETVSLEASKVWSDDDDVTHLRKDITLVLMRVTPYGQEEVEGTDACVISIDDPNKVCTWNNLASLEEGKTAVYTVKEVDVPSGYISTVKTSLDGNIIKAIVTNTYVDNDKITSLTYLDPLGSLGNMILKSVKFESFDLAQAESIAQDLAPNDPEHNRYRFLGWDINYDKNAGYILVAKYEPNTFHVTYIDPVSGKPIIKDDITSDASSINDPSNPNHIAEGLIFTGWKEVVDSDGNIMRIATYKCNCPKSPDKPDQPCPVNPSPGNSSYRPPKTGIIYSIIETLFNKVVY